MNSKAPLRNVAEKEIYDSFLGIMRISPNLNPNNVYSEHYVDEPTPYLLKTNWDTSTDGPGLQLSDSNGVGLGHYFIPRVFRTNVQTSSATKLVDLVLVTNYIPKLYVKEEIKIRSTLALESIISDDSPIKIVTKNETLPTHDVLYYPINSPYYSGYFNDRCCLENLDNEGDSIVITEPGYDGSRAEEMEEALLKKSPDWFKNENYIDRSHWVTLEEGENVYYSNEEFEAIPALYTHDFALGSYFSHTRTTDTAISGIPVHCQKSTKLSWIDIDQLIWKAAKDCLDGSLRHHRGHYNELGNDNSDLARIFGPIQGNLGAPDGIDHRFSVVSNNGEDSYLKNTAPILGQNVQVGTIINQAMPLRRLLFLQEKQKKYNAKYFSIKTVNASGNVVAMGVEADEYNGNISKMDRMVPSVANSLAKNFLLCDGAQISTTNHPYINIFNNDLFGNWYANIKDKGYEIKDKIDFKVNKAGIYDVIAASSDGKLMTPGLITRESVRYPLYIRGAQWDLDYDAILAGGMSYVTQTPSTLKNGDLVDADYPNEFLNDEELTTDFDVSLLNSNREAITVFGNYSIESSTSVAGTKFIPESASYVSSLPATLTNNYLVEPVKYEIVTPSGARAYLHYHTFNRFAQATTSMLHKGLPLIYGGSYDILGNKLRHRHYIFSRLDGRSADGPTYMMASTGNLYQSNSGLYGGPMPIRDIQSARSGGEDGGVNGWTTTSSWWTYNQGHTSEFYGGKPIRNYWLMYERKNKSISEEELLRNEEEEASYVASALGGYQGSNGSLDGKGIYIRIIGQVIERRKSWKKGHKWQNHRRTWEKGSNPSYQIGVALDNESGNYQPRCLTSLPFKNFSRFGKCDSSSVRDSYADQIKNLGAGSNPTCPHPPSIFLTPLIRI